MQNLIKAVLNVMSEVENIDKNMTVGKGTKAEYKAVSDMDVKLGVGKAMKKHGLIILPTGIEETSSTNYYTDKYGNQKQNTTTKVVTKYLLCHESGETIELSGYGHGVVLDIFKRRKPV